MFGFTGNYSKTKSWTAVAFTKSYFDEGRQRVTAAVMQGKINNDYDDYLGTGVSVDTTDHLNFFILRYTHRLLEHWYLGGQVLNSNYAMTGPNPEVQTIIDAAGLGGFESIGAGLVLEYDSKNRQRSASAGKYFVLHNIAYRKSFGGDVSFDTYEMKYTEYFANGPHVLAMNFHGRWTHNAPPSGYSSVYTKGYTRGQYLAPHISSLELDQRFAFNKHWGMSVYGAAACLYGKDGSEDANLSQSNEKSDCSNRENWYPSAATGIIYTLKPEQGIVIRADLAVGKGDNNGFYLSFGQPF
jgi:hypothetical protein